MIKWFKKHFIPHEHNEYQPHFLRHESVLAVGFLLIILELAFLVHVFVVLDKSNFLAAILPGVLTGLTNEERQNVDLPPLKENQLLVHAAQLKAQDMASKGYFAHTSPDGKSPWYWLSEVGYSYRYAGENLAVNFFESIDVAHAWMNSPTHAANVVKPAYTEIGIGTARGIYQGRNTVFVAQFFGTPLAVATTIEPLDHSPTGEAEIIPPEPSPSPQPEEIEVTETGVLAGEIETTPSEELTQIVPEILPTETIILGEEVFTTTPEINTTDTALVSKIKRALASPLHSVTYVYAGIGLLVIFALLMVLFIRSEFTHPKMIAKGFALISAIVLLLLINIKVFNTTGVVPEVGQASVINVFAP